MDEFGVKYVGKEHDDHLIDLIKENNDVTEYWEGKRYLGFIFDWSYDTRSVHLYMLNYIPDALKRFKREKRNKWQGYPTNTRSPIMAQNNNSQKQNQINRC